MATYRMENGTIVKTENATATWEEATRFDGRNRVSVATGSEWTHETLYRSRRGRYWIEHTSQWQGCTDWAEWVSPQRAAAWLLAMGHEIPADLQEAADQIEE